MFKTALSHAWKVYYGQEAGFEGGGEEYMLNSFWQWRFF